MKKILVTGAGGLLGKACVEHCLANGDEVVAYDHQSLDIADAERVEAVITQDGPDAVINCAAWTDVDGCESDPDKAERVNALGPENLARASHKADAVFITISTDYVFDGRKEGFYTQRDTPHPLSVYGRSKLEGERRSQEEYARTIVVRAGYIFGPGGRNFLSTIVERARRGEKLKAIRDCWGTPTYARDLAIRLRELVDLDLPGIFHVVSSGEGASFETFTREALKVAGCNPGIVEPVTMDSLPRPAPRPRNSKLKCLLSEAIGLPALPHWEEGLVHFVNQIGREQEQTGGVHESQNAEAVRSTPNAEGVHESQNAGVRESHNAGVHESHNAEGVHEFQPRVGTTLGQNIVRKD